MAPKAFTSILAFAFVLTTTFRPANASSPLRFVHQAEICFAQGSSALDDSTKILLLRLLYENILTNDIESYHVNILSFGDRARDRSISENQGRERADNIMKFFLEQRPNGKQLNSNQIRARGVGITSKEPPYVTNCSFPTQVLISGDCRFGASCNINWQCNPNGCVSKFKAFLY